MSDSLRRLVAFALLAFSSACASQGTATARPRPPDRDVISRTELDAHRFTTAYDAVASLRANWMHVKGADSFNTPTQILVYLDNAKVGGVDTLNGMLVNTITYIRHYNGVDASARWGLDHGQGVIFVSTRP